MSGRAAHDLWHLTIDDLLAAPEEPPRLGGAGPFVINLSASTAPITEPAKDLLAIENLRAYTIKRTEDGRTRYRLRLGPIASELEADAILASVREHYPSAFTVLPCEEDLRVLSREAKPARSSAASTAAAVTEQKPIPAPKPDLADLLAADADLSAPSDTTTPAELETELDLTPPAIATAPPALSATASATAEEFAIDFDAFLPPLEDPQVGAQPAEAAAPRPAHGHKAKPAPAPKTKSAKKSRAAAKTRAPKAQAHHKPVTHELPKAPVVAKHEPVQAQPVQKRQPVAKREPVVVAAPSSDPNAATDQVEILQLPVDDAALEFTLDDAGPLPVARAASNVSAAESQLAAILAAPAVPASARAAPLEVIVSPEVAVPPDVTSMAVVAPSARVSQPAESGEFDLASIVAKNNAMVESLEAREVQDQAAGPLMPVADATRQDVVLELAEVPQALALTEVPQIVALTDVPVAPLADAPQIVALTEVLRRAAIPEAVIEAPPVLDDVVVLELSLASDELEAQHDAVTVDAMVPVVIDAVIPVVSDTVSAAAHDEMTRIAPAAELTFDVDVLIALMPAEDLAKHTATAAPSAALIEDVDVLEAVDFAQLTETVDAIGATDDSPAQARQPASTPQVQLLSDPLPEMDSTQTIREITPLELADGDASRHFVIQLSLTDEQVDPEAIPHLDIFNEYRLYTVAGMTQGEFRHALRVGFFSDEASALAVAGYLGCFFDGPVVKRVAQAERDRFARQRVVPKRDVGSSGNHQVIELSTAPRVRETTLAELAPERRKGSSDSGSLWSRLVSPLRR